MEKFHIFPVGTIRQGEGESSIVIFDEFRDALLGLEPFSHIIVLIWFHKSDNQEKRNTLQVHPKGNRSNPLTGVFATRSPVRPNPVALFTCKVLSIKEDIIRIDHINAFDGSPVIDIKPYIPEEDSVLDAVTADWLSKDTR